MNKTTCEELPRGVAVYVEQARAIVMIPEAPFLHDDTFIGLLIDMLLRQPINCVLELRLYKEQQFERMVGSSLF